MEKKKIFIIEHLEPKLWQWCLIEYEHMSETVGKENLWFTNIKNNADERKLNKFGKVFKESVTSMNLPNVCVLDPEIEETLSPEKAKDIEYFVFGGILGDYPPKKRTKEELTKFIKNKKVFNIGKEQMSTDNAVYVVSQIIKGKNFEDLKFKEGVSIEINDVESVELPFRYTLINGEPFMSKKIVEYLKKKKGF
jgi:ribosome biogenesis SPOUT family RNA methylase Rps3